MKHNLRIFGSLLLTALFQWSCTDTCKQTVTYKTFKSLQIGQESLKASIKAVGGTDLVNPGKIYAYDQYLFISEVKKGIHVIDNSDPKNPKNIAFVQVPGVLDMTVKDEVLYVDNYTDLVALSIANPLKIVEIGRKPLQFTNGLHEGTSWYYDPFSRIITDAEAVYVTEKRDVNCNDGGIIYPFYRGGIAEGDVAFKNGTAGGQATGGSPTGTGGSMARFTVYDDYLYAATQSDLQVYSIKTLNKPDSVSKINLGWGIETIFPYGDKLFIGSNTGMHIYDNSNPRKPSRLSVFQHVRACDPVVVEGQKAYVTLREGWCGASPNRLDVVDINNLSTPFLIKSYEMQNPHGLSISNNILTICEGAFGLKSYDASNAQDIKLKQHIKDFQAFDVIQLPGNLLLVIGKDGLMQYDNSNPAALKFLSTIAVKKPTI
jgi:hypothetical protein